MGLVHVLQMVEEDRDDGWIQAQERSTAPVVPPSAADLRSAINPSMHPPLHGHRPTDGLLTHLC